MVFSMYMNKFLLFVGISIILAGCVGHQSGHWSADYDEQQISVPQDVRNAYMQSASLYGSDDGGRENANIAVLLPLTGESKTSGNAIKTSVEAAFLQKPKNNIKISFYDLSGDKMKRNTILQNVVSTNPDVIIGPLFADDVKTLHEIKSNRLPVLSFTSDVTALGDGVMTMNLVPSQSIEAIIQQIQADNKQDIIVFAPNDKSGQLMASLANQISDLYNVNMIGLYYYDSGNSDSIKDVSSRAALYNTRKAVNTRAREILSDILTKENISGETRGSLIRQLEKISRTETTGKLPYSAILFLGNGEDSKALISFLRYYGINSRDIALYGTALWQNADIATDFAMNGAKYVALPEISEDFNMIYSNISGNKPDYLAAFGYDATNLALSMLFSDKSETSYLLDPSGYVGSTGVFRLQPSGQSEHALRIMVLNGSETPNVLKEAQTNFLKPLYNMHSPDLTPIPEQPISTHGINPGDYINIPENLRKKTVYKTKTIGANYYNSEQTETQQTSEPIQIYASDENETISNPDFEPVKLESISRENIDSVEITE